MARYEVAVGVEQIVFDIWAKNEEEAREKALSDWVDVLNANDLGSFEMVMDVELADPDAGDVDSESL